MNFFAHASVAAEFVRADSTLVLGAMLPDFTGMLGLRAPELHDPQLREGVEFHHHTDAVFHACPTFTRLMGESFADLSERGVRRGTARAVSHIGVEILLDGVMARTPHAVTSYRQALRSPATGDLSRMMSWPDPGLGAQAQFRLERLRRLLADREIQEDSWLPRLVTTRLERALSGRPRLELQPDDVPHVSRWVVSYQSSIENSAGTLLEELFEGLAQRLA